MKTRIFILFVLLLFLLTACGKADPTAENTNAPLETEMQGSAGDSNAVIPSQESDDWHRTMLILKQNRLPLRSAVSR